ncbi:MAG: hypothetical protein ACXWQO_16930 [Bdellovibrionota bacterium]
MRFLLKITLLLVAFGVSSLAFAEGDFAMVFLQKGTEIPAALESLSHRQFGERLRLDALQKAAKAVKIVMDSDVGKRNSQGRMSARWEMVNGVGTISVNAAWWEKFSEQQSILALHEYLGAYGLVDDEYFISTSMWFLSLSDTQKLLTKTKKETIEAWIKANADLTLLRGTRLAGGVVGVGGGGEGASLFVRMNGLERALRALKDTHSSEEQRQEAFHDIEHYLSTPLTVMWRSSNN